jgi:uncharacterized membrane protein YeaQ/YmgE (transglycosylase-associated protein family)
MFSQRSGANQSIASSVMSAIIGFIVQKMMGGGSSGGMGNMLAGLTGGGTGGSSGGGIGSIKDEKHQLLTFSCYYMSFSTLIYLLEFYLEIV